MRKKPEPDSNPAPDSSALPNSSAAPATVEEYLERVPLPARTTLEIIRQRIRAALPTEATESISYGMPAFRLKKPLIGYAAFSGHCSIFPMSGTVITAMAEELKHYSTSKGTIRFPIGKPLPASLIKKIVKARLAETTAAKR